ncbi:hypothetical protein MESS4_750170 [Mesorhizobium sp. STM 4661]|nr:hypothetical protein MESS4_750170 [Mesorhizobium sp. STM 4661]
MEGNFATFIVMKGAFFEVTAAQSAIGGGIG